MLELLLFQLSNSYEREKLYNRKKRAMEFPRASQSIITNKMGILKCSRTYSVSYFKRKYVEHFLTSFQDYSCASKHAKVTTETQNINRDAAQIYSEYNQTLI